MNTANPKISVLMSVYNGASYLQEAIDSVLTQTYTNFEFIIIDDCSTDNSLDIINQNATRDNRILPVYNPENLGLIKSLNKGIKIAKGEFIARQDADDISLPQRFAKEVAFLKAHVDCALVSCNLQVIRDDDKAVIDVIKLDCHPILISWYLLFYNHIGGHSQVMYRRDVVLSLGSYSESHPYMEDFELWCRIARTGMRLAILPEILLTYRKHGQSVSVQKQEQQAYNCYQQTQANLQWLLGQEVTLEMVKDLIGFWNGNRTSICGLSHHLFPPASKAEFVYNVTLQLRDAFIQKYKGNQNIAEISQKIDALIVQQFACWLRSPLTKQHSIKSKILISRCLLLLSPRSLIQAWLIWLLRLPLDTGISLLRKTNFFVSRRRLFNFSKWSLY